MRRLTFLVLIMAALYSGYWVLGARTVEGEAQGALATLVQDGWNTGTTAAATRGFPSRFDTTFSDIDLTAPDGSLRYQTPFAQIFALSYRPTEVIVALAPTQTLDVAGQRLTLETDGLRASGSVATNVDLSFKEATVEAARLGFSSDLGFSLSARKLLLATRTGGPAPRAYDAYLSLADIELPRTAAAQAPISGLSLDTTLTLSRVLDRHVMTGSTPQLQGIDVNEVALDWAGAVLRGDGTLTVMADGTLNGEIALTITNHANLIEQLSYVGVVDPGVAPTWVNMADAMASGQPVLALPLRFANGLMSLGPFPMGPAPRLR